MIRVVQSQEVHLDIGKLHEELKQYRRRLHIRQEEVLVRQKRGVKKETLRWPPFMKAVLRECVVQRLVKGREYRLLSPKTSSGLFGLRNYVEAVDLLVFTGKHRTFLREIMRRPTDRLVNAILQRVHRMYSESDGKKGTRAYRDIAHEHPFVHKDFSAEVLHRAGKTVSKWYKEYA